MVNIFISHSHKDKALANAIDNTLKSWCDKLEIFNSSRNDSGVDDVSKLDEQLLQRVRDTDLFIFLHTENSPQCERCNLELSWASEQSQTKSRQIVVLRFVETALPPHVSGIIYKAWLEYDVSGFTYRFLNEREFLVRDDSTREKYAAIIASLKCSKEDSDAKGKALWQNLQQLHPLHTPNERARLDCIILSISAAGLQQVTSARTENETLKAVKECCYLDRTRSDPAAFGKFGFHELNQDTSLGKLLTQWNEATRPSNRRTAWQIELASDLKKAIDGLSSDPYQYYFKSADGSGRYQAIVTRYRRKGDGSMEFDLLLFKKPRSALFGWLNKQIKKTKVANHVPESF